MFQEHHYLVAKRKSVKNYCHEWDNKKLKNEDFQIGAQKLIFFCSVGLLE